MSECAKECNNSRNNHIFHKTALIGIKLYVAIKKNYGKHCEQGVHS